MIKVLFEDGISIEVREDWTKGEYFVHRPVFINPNNKPLFREAGWQVTHASGRHVMTILDKKVDLAQMKLAVNKFIMRDLYSKRRNKEAYQEIIREAEDLIYA
jgi:hypothetical protein